MATKIGDRLKQIRGHQSQASFAKVLGVHKNTLGGYERGERHPDSELLSALISLGYNANWVLTGQGPMMMEVVPDRAQAPKPFGDLVDEHLETIQRLLERWSEGQRSLERSDKLDIGGAMNGEQWEAYEWLRTLLKSGSANADQRKHAKSLIDHYFIDTSPKAAIVPGEAFTKSRRSAEEGAQPPPVARPNDTQRKGIAPAAERPKALPPEFYALLAGPLMAHTDSAQERQAVMGTVLKVLEASTGNDPRILAGLEEEQLDKLVAFASSVYDVAASLKEETALQLEGDDDTGDSWF